MGIENIIFLAIAIAAITLFAVQLNKIRRNIRLGKPFSRTDQQKKRLNTMLLVAFGQQKMFKRPLPALLHAFVYIGFLVINIEVLEILIDGITGTHRVLGFMGPVYDALMATNEILGALVIIACIIFLWRRNISKLKRLNGPEMAKFPKLDGNIILITEIVLMFALFLFNSADLRHAALTGEKLPGAFPISSLWVDALHFDTKTALALSHTGWWIHIIGIFAFMNYLPISKHFHIIMAFPNTYYSRLTPKGQLENSEFITHEIKSTIDPSYDSPNGEEMPRFGAKDIPDLSAKALMDAYTCTECGRCTSVCPANLTGKKLSPRKIIMDTRDRIEELSKAGIKTGEKAIEYAEKNGNTLLGGYISAEELWACTTCNACVEACPVNIDHVTEIVALRQHMVLEESSAPQELNIMFNNIENNGAPWAMPASSRFDWANEIEMAADKFAKVDN